MKRFIIASIIFIVVALIGIFTDAIGLDTYWEAMPNILYYAFGWLAAGIYIAISTKIKKEDK